MKFLKGISLGFIVGVFIMRAMPTMAKNSVDSVQMTPKDSTSKELEPFIYNKITYLPVG